MDLLQVSPFAAYPPEMGGHHRTHGLVTGRSPADTVYRFSQVPIRSDDRISEDGFLTVDDNYEIYRYPNYVHSGLVFVLDQPFFASQVLQLARPKQLLDWIARADAIMVEHPWQYPAIYNMKPEDTPILFSSHNVEHEFFLSYTPNPDEPSARIKHWRIKQLEGTAVSTADLIVVTSERDRDMYRDVYGVDGPFHVAPNAAYLSDVPARDSWSDSERLRHDIDPDDTLVLFVGSRMDHNEKAVEKIIEIARSAEIRDEPIAFLIVGTVADAFDEETVPPNVNLVGFVEDLDPYYRRCDVALNPVTEGEGSNVKMAEFLAKGMVVVSTPHGTRGYPTENGRDLIEVNLEEFPRTIRDVCDGTIDTEYLSTNAQRLIEKEVNWETVSRELLDAIRRVSGASEASIEYTDSGSSVL